MGHIGPTLIPPTAFIMVEFTEQIDPHLYSMTHLESLNGNTFVTFKRSERPNRNSIKGLNILNEYLTCCDVSCGSIGVSIVDPLMDFIEISG